MKLERAKGTRDFMPEEMIVRDYLVDTLKECFELFGFSPTDTPAVERWDMLSAKDTGGSEIMKETFKFKDQGKRELGLRYDLTIPFARVVGMNPNIKLPFKRYQIGKVWRDGPTATGRYREFMQCDVDVVGCKKMTADAELVALASMFFKKIGLDAVIKINNRKLINGIVDSVGIKEDNLWDVLVAIDKLEKVGESEVKKELVGKKIDKKAVDELMKTLLMKDDIKGIISKLKKKKNEELEVGIKETEELFSYLDEMKVKAELDLSLARGLAYYTGTVFEIVLEKSKITSSVTGGGRYDNMIGIFVKKDMPAVGISFGLDRIYDAYIEKNDIEKKTTTEYYIIPIGTTKECMKIAQDMRSKGKKVDVDLLERGPSKNMKYADSMGIPYAVFIGENELKKGEVSVKDMKTGKEKSVKLKDL